MCEEEEVTTAHPLRPANTMIRKTLFACTLATLALACSDSTGPAEDAELQIRFSGRTIASSVPGSGMAPATATAVEGSNGTLEIDQILLIVSEFELESDDDLCEDDDGPDCDDFESLPFLVDLPLDGGEVTVATDAVPTGIYDELEFEVEDVDLGDDGDDDDQEKQDAIESILQDLRALYPLFPEDASMVARGTFTPTEGAPRDFTVFFEAEIEVEMEFSPPIEVPGVGSVTVVVDPSRWFGAGDTVLDLSAFDGQLLDFEVEIEDGFTEIEIDDD